MHGQRREEYKARLRDDATATKLATKANQWHILSSGLLKSRKSIKDAVAVAVTEGKDSKDVLKNGNHLGDTLKLIDKLVSVNPDPIYLWNHRRDILILQLRPSTSTSTSTDACESKDLCYCADVPIQSFIQQEQLVTQNALQRNPKAYGAWFHRKWSIRQYILLSMKHNNENQKSSPDDDDNNNINYINTNVNNTKQTAIHVLKGELELCKEFLTMDERNFHCWNYRRFIVAMLANVTIMIHDTCTSKICYNTLDGGWDFLSSFFTKNDNSYNGTNYSAGSSFIGSQLACTKNNHQDKTNDANSISSKSQIDKNCMDNIQQILDKEWKFTTEKIEQNFSNGSAFHYRSKLLTMLHHIHPQKLKSDWIQQELELIRNAIFTEPDDQTSWWYFRFILSWSNPMENSETNLLSSTSSSISIDEYKQIIYEEWLSIQELVEAEERHCKWGLLGLFMIAMIFVELERKYSVDGAMEYQDEHWLDLAKSYLDELKVLDPDRINRYQSMECNLV